MPQDRCFCLGLGIEIEAGQTEDRLHHSFVFGALCIGDFIAMQRPAKEQS